MNKPDILQSTHRRVVILISFVVIKNLLFFYRNWIPHLFLAIVNRQFRSQNLYVKDDFDTVVEQCMFKVHSI